MHMAWQRAVSNLLYLVSLYLVTAHTHTLGRYGPWLKLLFLIQQQLRLINLKMFALVVVMSRCLLVPNASISHAACPFAILPLSHSF